MRTDVQDALLSVKEVAVFAWSLLELLLTRILPLASFLAGHLLLQFSQLLASVVIPTAGRRKSPTGYFGNVQAEKALLEEDNVQVVKEDADDYKDDLESLKSTNKLEERQRDEDGTDEEAGGGPPPDGQSAVNEAQMHRSDHKSVTSSDMQRIHVPALDTPANDHEVIGCVEQEEDVPSKAGGSAGKPDLELSDAGTGEEATSSGTSTSEEAANPASSTDEGEMRQGSRRRRMRVLPPSLSQVKRTLMQRSRRASPSASPALLAPSPSPINKKQQHHGSRRSASSSYDNVMRKFRQQFLL